MSCGRAEAEERALEALRPSALQLKLLGSLYQYLRQRVSSCLEKKGISAEVEVEGSFAKGTILNRKWEIDVFVLFEMSESWVKERSLDVLKDCLSPLPFFVKYAEHPYVTVSLMGLEAEVVPATMAESPSRLGVGRTPFHTRYVARKVKENPCIADEIRLLKSFMEAIGVYGAEVGGFSGYLAELLVINYGSFRRTLETALSWKPQVYIDIEGIGNERSLREKYKDSPMIVVDPVDPARNAAASVTLSSLSAFIVMAGLYLSRPTEKLLLPHLRSPQRVGPSLLMMCRGNYDDLPKENLIGMLRRALSLASSRLEERGFVSSWKAFWSDYSSRALLLLGLESLSLPELEVRKGPRPWDSIKGSHDFVAKRAEEEGIVWVGEEGHLVGLRRRKITRAREVLSGEEVARVLKATSCAIEECDEGIECLEREGVKPWSLIGLPLLLPLNTI
ncbi:MAG: CCA tRNA nucleotidyltransferase [Acidilobaceae archaeon]|nr:CCA tRNA nucleotidyltransferase [Acidilobaceae archaeon]